MKVVVTEHALVRYAERILGIDFAPLRAKLEDQVRSAALAGATKFTLGGAMFVIEQTGDVAKVVTVTLPGANFRSLRPKKDSTTNKHQRARDIRIAKQGGVRR